MSYPVDLNDLAARQADWLKTMGLLQKEIDKVVSELESASPQQREWVGLSDDKVEEIAKQNGAWQLYSSLKIFDFVANINDELKQLNTKG